MYTSARFSRSWSLVLATGYIVLSGNVSALRNVCIEVFSRLTNGSFTGNLSEPHSTECSRMWNTPVSSTGGVLNEMENALFSSALCRNSRRAPLFPWRITMASPSISGNGSTDSTAKPFTAAASSTSDSSKNRARAPWDCSAMKHPFKQALHACATHRDMRRKTDRNPLNARSV